MLAAWSLTLWLQNKWVQFHLLGVSTLVWNTRLAQMREADCTLPEPAIGNINY